jgi:hypothetical protein
MDDDKDILQMLQMYAILLRVGDFPELAFNIYIIKVISPCQTSNGNLFLS